MRTGQMPFAAIFFKSGRLLTTANCKSKRNPGRIKWNQEVSADAGFSYFFLPRCLIQNHNSIYPGILSLIAHPFCAIPYILWMS
ncbi:hypothetical protein SAMN05216420_10218 [Nitrosospira sp. Nl5]|nr:hypothetical protein SAMN05216420_10218 [Nitrosospira sp. Nl5]